MHSGNESSCKSLDFSPTANFNYQFSQAPQDGSKVWAIKAIGNRISVGVDDQILLISDDQANITCQGKGNFLGVC